MLVETVVHDRGCKNEGDGGVAGECSRELGRSCLMKGVDVVRESGVLD